MSAPAAPITAPAFPVRWSDTQAGRAEAWIRPTVMQMAGKKPEKRKDKGN